MCIHSFGVRPVTPLPAHDDSAGSAFRALLLMRTSCEFILYCHLLCHLGASDPVGNFEPTHPRHCRRRTWCGSGSEISCVHFSPLKYSVSAPVRTVITTTTMHLLRCAMVMMMATSPVKINTCSLRLAENASPEHYDCQSLWVVFCGRFATIILVLVLVVLVLALDSTGTRRTRTSTRY